MPVVRSLADRVFACTIEEVASPAYVLLTVKDKFDHPTRRVHEQWQADFTYFKMVGWGWYYLLTELDDYGRFIMRWKLFTGMEAGDVRELLEAVIEETVVEGVEIPHRPRLLSGNGPRFLSEELRKFQAEFDLKHTHGKPYHPMTQGKIERYRRSFGNVVELQSYYLPWELERDLARRARAGLAGQPDAR